MHACQWSLLQSLQRMILLNVNESIEQYQSVLKTLADILFPILANHYEKENDVGDELEGATVRK